MKITKHSFRCFYLYFFTRSVDRVFVFILLFMSIHFLSLYDNLMTARYIENKSSQLKSVCGLGTYFTYFFSQSLACTLPNQRKRATLYIQCNKQGWLLLCKTCMLYGKYVNQQPENRRTFAYIIIKALKTLLKYTGFAYTVIIP